MAKPSDPALAASLAQLAQVMRDTRDDWWVIGSAAVALHGGDPGEIADIDVIVSRRDLDALYERLSLADTPDAGKAMFRSQRFGLWSEPALPVEFMAGLQVLRGGQWLSVQVQSRAIVRCGTSMCSCPNVRSWLPSSNYSAAIKTFGAPPHFREFLRRQEPIAAESTMLALAQERRGVGMTGASR